MGLLWLTGFLLGAVFGGMADWFAGSFAGYLGAASLLLVLSGKSSSIPIKSLVLLGGVLWGWSHNAPAPERDYPEAVVLNEGFVQSGPMFLLVEAEGHRFLARGSGTGGTHGTLRSRQSGYFLQAYSGTFRPTFVPEQTTVGSQIARQITKPDRLPGTRNRIPADILIWAKSIVLGDFVDLPKELMDVFKRLGIIHLIVVSGLHVTLIGLVLEFLLVGPFRLFYAVRLISPPWWVQTSAVLQILCALLVFLFAVAVGLPQSAQRSALVFLIVKLMPIFVGHARLDRRLIASGIIQAVIFPIGFISISNILSWSAYITVLCYGDSATSVKSYCNCQIALTCLTAAILGQFAPLGVFVNFLVVPVFSFIFLLASLLLVSAYVPDKLIDFSVGVQVWFLQGLERFDAAMRPYPITYMDLAARNPFYLREIFLFLAAFLLLNNFRDLSIRCLNAGKLAEKKRVTQ